MKTSKVVLIVVIILLVLALFIFVAKFSVSEVTQDTVNKGEEDIQALADQIACGDGFCADGENCPEDCS